MKMEVKRDAHIVYLRKGVEDDRGKSVVIALRKGARAEREIPTSEHTFHDIGPSETEKEKAKI